MYLRLKHQSVHIEHSIIFSLSTSLTVRENNNFVQCQNKGDCAYVYNMYNNIYDYIQYGSNSLKTKSILLTTDIVFKDLILVLNWYSLEKKLVI